MEEKKPITPNSGAYAIPGLNLGEIEANEKKTLTRIIAEAWGIPEDKVLGSTEVIFKKTRYSTSARWERTQIPGERKQEYVNARKFWFYVMVRLRNTPWPELRQLTGRKISAMLYAASKAELHMKQEKSYMDKAQYVMKYINDPKNLVIYPKVTIKLDANATVIERSGADEDIRTLQLPEAGE